MLKMSIARYLRDNEVLFPIKKEMGWGGGYRNTYNIRTQVQCVWHRQARAESPELSTVHLMSVLVFSVQKERKRFVFLLQ